MYFSLLRYTLILSSGLNALGMTLKACAFERDLFPLVMIGQTFSALAKAFILPIPTKIAMVWFLTAEMNLASTTMT